MATLAPSLTDRLRLRVLAADVLDDVEFDVSEQEVHRSTAKVTDHPVEEGSNIADHIVLESDTLDLIARVTNTPIVSESIASGLTPRRAELAYEALRALKDARAVVGVRTTLRTYRSMAIVSLSVTRNSGTGEALSIALSLREIRTATSATVQAPQPRDARGSSKVSKGKQPTEDASAATTERSESILLGQGRRLPGFSELVDGT